MIATNTTIVARRGGGHAACGRSRAGCPARRCSTLSNTVIRALKAELGDALPIIGVGGILRGADARAKMRRGRALVQLYSGLIYRGPALVRECADALRGHGAK